MSKKKKKKLKKGKDLIKQLSKNLKNHDILGSENGKITFKKDVTIDISHYIDNSVDNAKMSRLEGIPTKENVVIDAVECNYRINVMANLTPIHKSVDLITSVDVNDVQTIVIPMTKNKARKLESNRTIEWLGKTSTFAVTYSKLRKKWIAMNDGDSTMFTNVLYIPNICVFLTKNEELRTRPIMINLMIVAVPHRYDSNNGIDVVETSTYISRIIDDTTESCIRCGCKSIILNPYAIKEMESDVHFTARYWYGKTETQRVIENIRNVTFSINDDNLYVIFCKNRQSV